jgi:predicted RNA-binding Zn-ribbon protein involved in translation (DUF1610 family)
MAQLTRYVPTCTVPLPGFSTREPKPLPPCPECGLSELMWYIDKPTQTEEIVCLECGHVIPDSPTAAGGVR